MHLISYFNSLDRKRRIVRNPRKTALISDIITFNSHFGSLIKQVPTVRWKFNMAFLFNLRASLRNRDFMFVSKCISLLEIEIRQAGSGFQRETACKGVYQ